METNEEGEGDDAIVLALGELMVEDDWTMAEASADLDKTEGWTWISNRQRSGSSVSSYSYVSSSASEAVEGRGERQDGRILEATRYDEAIAASLQDAEHSGYFATDAAASAAPSRTRSFFSPSGLPLDVQLRTATWCGSVRDLSALGLSSTWTWRPHWRAATAPGRVESLSLAEAAAAELVVNYLGFHQTLPATLATANVAKRLSLARAAVVVAPARGLVHVAASEVAASCAAFGYRAEDKKRHTFDDPVKFRDSADDPLLGLVALKGPPHGPAVWRAYLLDAKHQASRLALADGAFTGWVNNRYVRKLPFPLLHDPTAGPIGRLAIDRASHILYLDRPKWHALVGEARSLPRQDPKLIDDALPVDTSTTTLS